jgi:hypothetical protein
MAVGSKEARHLTAGAAAHRVLLVRAAARPGKALRLPAAERDRVEALPVAKARQVVKAMAVAVAETVPRPVVAKAVKAAALVVTAVDAAETAAARRRRQAV